MQEDRLGADQHAIGLGRLLMQKAMQLLHPPAALVDPRPSAN